MPQTSDVVPRSCAKVMFSIESDCTPWINVSGSVNAIPAPAQTKMVGEEYTFAGDGALVEIGKMEPFDITVRIVYTETDGEAYQLERDQFLLGACQGRMCLYWSPGGGAGDLEYVTNYAPITSHQWPEVDAGAAGPIMAEFTLRVSTITTSTSLS